MLDVARDRETRADLAMEAVFILSEIGSADATVALEDLAKSVDLDAEARCAAVWGLGVGGARRPDLVLPFIADEDEQVALHALAAIDELPGDLLPQAQRMIGGSEREAAAAVTLLVTHEAVEALMDVVSSGGRERAWAVFGLGQLHPGTVEAQAGNRLTRELRAELAPFWTGEHSNWVRREGNTERLLLLAQQRVRYRPEDAS